MFQLNFESSPKPSKEEQDNQTNRETKRKIYQIDESSRKKPKQINNNSINSIDPASTSTSTSSNSKKPKGLVNNEYCNYCLEGGNIINCDRCPASFHILCHEPPLNPDQIPKGEFLCNKCKAQAAVLAENGKAQINDDINTIQFYKFNDETPLKTLIRLSKSVNPRQMFFPSELSSTFNVKFPGLNKYDWLNKNLQSTTSNSTTTSNSIDALSKVYNFKNEMLAYLKKVSNARFVNLRANPKEANNQPACNIELRPRHNSNSNINGNNNSSNGNGRPNVNRSDSIISNGSNNVLSNGLLEIKLCFVCQK